MKYPLVSVLMTAYNREKYIGEAIESVIASTYKNWELIIVDDCSSDRTVEIARSYEVKDDRIKVYINEKNLGDYPNRNRAASYAKGKYLKYVDADDLIYPYGLEIMVDNMERFPESGWGLMSLSQDSRRMYPFQLSPPEIYNRHFFHSSVFHKAPLSSVIKADTFQEIKGFKPVRHYGDMDMWMRLAMKYPVVLMQEGLVWWRAHDDQEAQKRKHKLHLPMITANAIIDYVLDRQCPLNEREKYQAIKRIKNFKRKLILQRIRKFDLKGTILLLKNF